MLRGGSWSLAGCDRTLSQHLLERGRSAMLRQQVMEGLVRQRPLDQSLCGCGAYFCVSI